MANPNPWKAEEEEVTWDLVRKGGVLLPLELEQKSCQRALSVTRLAMLRSRSL